MATKITKCIFCGSHKVKCKTPEIVKTINKPLCTVSNICLECNKQFETSVATDWGRRKGIRY